MNDRDPVLYRLLEISDGSTTVDLITPPIGRGHVWVMESISLMDDTTAGADVQIGVYDGNVYTWLRTVDLTTANWWYWLTFTLTLLTGYQVVCRFLNTVDGDRIYANVLGYVREPFTSP